MANQQAKCRHEGCTCTASDRGYCSPYCESHRKDQKSEPGCACGHPGCAA